MKVCSRHWRNVDVDRIAARNPDLALPEWHGQKVGSVVGNGPIATAQLERLQGAALMFDGDCNLEVNPRVSVDLEFCPCCGSEMVEVGP